MTDYKMVPVELTPEMIQAFKAMWSLGFCDDRMAQECYASIMDAAPAVQGEPVGHATGQFAAVVEGPLTFTVQAYGRLPETGAKLYLAPQSAEQQPSAGDSLTSVPDEVFAAEFAAWWEEHGQFCRAGGGTYERSFAFEAWRHLYPQLMNLQMAAAEHQPAPDVADYKQVLDEQWRLTRELDVLLNGEEGAAQQASLADLVAQLRTVVRNTGKPVLAAPDVAGLESALKSMVSGYMRLLQSGYDRITDLGGDCDPVDVMERDDAYLREARAALAAYRKGGE